MIDYCVKRDRVWIVECSEAENPVGRVLTLERADYAERLRRNDDSELSGRGAEP